MIILSKEKLYKIAKELMVIAYPAIFSTVDEKGQPHVRAIENMRNPEKFPHDAKVLKDYDDTINPYINTNTSSEKVKHILRNRNAAMYYSSPTELGLSPSYSATLCNLG